jgi:hypothetical protein
LGEFEGRKSMRIMFEKDRSYVAYFNDATGEFNRTSFQRKAVVFKDADGLRIAKKFHNDGIEIILWNDRGEQLPDPFAVKESQSEEVNWVIEGKPVAWRIDIRKGPNGKYSHSWKDSYSGEINQITGRTPQEVFESVATHPSFAAQKHVAELTAAAEGANRG